MEGDGTWRKVSTARPPSEPMSLSHSFEPFSNRGDLGPEGPDSDQRPTQPPHTGNTWPTKQSAALLHR